MANQFPFPLVPQFKKIFKLVGDPSRTVAKWVNEKTKLMTPDPMKPHKKKKTQKLTLDGNKLQKTLVQIINKIDEIIDGLNKIPEIDALKLTHDALKAGAVGVDMGRNIWQSENPVPMIKAVRSIVHQNFTVEDAWKLYTKL